MVDINSSLIVQMINFIVLIFVLNALLYKPIRGILKTRKETIGKLQADIEGFTKESEQKADAFKERLKEARAEGLRKKEALMQEAKDEEKRKVDEINKRAHEELEKVKETIRKDTERVKASLMKQVDTFAREIGQKILGRAV